MLVLKKKTFLDAFFVSSVAQKICEFNSKEKKKNE